MAEERGWWDSIKDMSGKDWAGFGLESALYANQGMQRGQL